MALRPISLLVMTVGVLACAGLPTACGLAPAEYQPNGYQPRRRRKFKGYQRQHRRR